MAQEPEPPPPGWVRDHLANERTLLAWIRTAIAFMAFGVAVAKLSVLLYMGLIDHPELHADLPSPARSEIVGVMLILFGGAIAATGIIKTQRWALRINPAYRAPRQVLLWVVAVMTVLLALLLLVYVLA